LRAGAAARAGAQLSRQVRLHSRLTRDVQGVRGMRRVLTAGHGRTGAVRALALLAIAAALAGCNTDREVVLAYPTDVRHRHPITISEGVRTVELFVGTSRGSLTPKQRADVGGFAHSWAHEGTGGIVIDLPTDTPNAHAAADVLPEIRSILAA